MVGHHVTNRFLMKIAHQPKAYVPEQLFDLTSTERPRVHHLGGHLDGMQERDHR